MYKKGLISYWGEMPERLKGHDWKSCVGLKALPRVRIPLSPPGTKGRGFFIPYYFPFFANKLRRV